MSEKVERIMAEQDSTTPANGAGEAPQVAALAQYIKDLSVENPSAPTVYQWQEQPQLDVQFNINVNKVADEVQEVTLKIDASARSNSGVQFVIDLSYAGLFALRNIPEESLAPFLLIEAPRLLFPFARQVIASATQDMGFPPLMLDPIDFAGIFMAQQQSLQDQFAQAQAQGQTGGSDLPDGGEPTVQ